MNNEPVAWTAESELDNFRGGSPDICVVDEKDGEFNIPLYTKPQITELSDEEIKEFIEDIIDAMGLSMEFTAVRKSGWDIGIKKFRELSKASVK